MNINKINNENINFRGFAVGAKARILARATHNSKAVEQLIKKIETSYKDYTVDFVPINYTISKVAIEYPGAPVRYESVSAPEIFRIYKQGSHKTQIVRMGKIFNNTMLSCLKKIDKLLSKETGIVDSKEPLTIAKAGTKSQKTLISSFVEKIDKFLNPENQSSLRELWQKGNVKISKAKEPTSILDMPIESLPILKQPVSGTEPPKIPLDSMLKKPRVTHGIKDFYAQKA